MSSKGLWLLAMAVALGPGVPALGAEIEVDERGRLSAEVGEEPLEGVLQAIGEEAGIDVRFSGELGPARPQRFEGVPLATGIRLLVGSRPLIMVFGTGDPPAVERIRVGPPPDPAKVQAAREQGAAAQARLRGPVAQAPGNAADRLDAVRVATRDGGPGSFEVLVEAATSDENVAIRQAAVQSLGRLASPDAIEPLFDVALNDDQAQVRIEAVRGLLRTEPVEAAEAMVQIMEIDGDAQVRRVVVQLAASLDPDLSDEVFEIALEDENDAVRQAAEAAFGG